MNPAVSDQLFQRRLRQTFNVHSAFVAEVDEFLYQLCRAASIPAEKLMRSTSRFSNLQRCAAAGTEHGKPVCTTPCQIVRNLRNDHIRAVYPNRITGAQLKRMEIVQIMQVGASNCRAVHIDGIEPCGQTDHSGTRRCKFNAAECGFIQFILPFERDQAVFMVPGSAETFAIRKIVIFHDKTVDRVPRRPASTVNGYIRQARGRRA